jgi:hypothetical protein
MFRRRGEFSDLESRLRACRPQPPAETLARLEKLVGASGSPAARRQSRGLRVGVATAFAVGFVALFGAIGGFSLSPSPSATEASPVSTSGSSGGGSTAAPTAAAPPAPARPSPGLSESTPGSGGAGTSVAGTSTASTTSPPGAEQARPDGTTRQLATYNQYFGWTVICKRFGHHWAFAIVPKWTLPWWIDHGWSTSCFRH